jgi:hypothetical protein
MYTSQNKCPKKPPGQPRKRLCVFLILLGICTFLLPIIFLDSPVLNRTAWSPLNIVAKFFEGELPVLGGGFDNGLITMALIYLLMPLALVAVFRPGPPKALYVISWIGVFLDGVLMGRNRHIEMLDPSTFGHSHMKAGLAWWVLACVMPALLALCFAANLDHERINAGLVRAECCDDPLRPPALSKK